MKSISTAVAALLLGAAPAAFAQDAAAPAPAAPAQELKGPTVGATVLGPDGQPAATIESITGNVAVLSTGTNKISVPLDRIGKGPNGPTIGVAKAQLDALAGQAAAQTKAAIVPGAQVRGSAGVVLATVKASTDQAVTLSTPEGKEVAVPVAAIATTEQGLTINMTAEQFQAAVNQAAPAAPAQPTQ